MSIDSLPPAQPYLSGGRRPGGCGHQLPGPMTLAAGRRLAEDGHMADRELIEEAVTLASRAPSLHNSQPWRWLAFRGGLALFLDRRRIVGSTDEGGRQAVISCGVMLDHLRVAAAAAGQRAEIERFPDAGDRTCWPPSPSLPPNPPPPTAAAPTRSWPGAPTGCRCSPRRSGTSSPPRWAALGAPADSGVRLDVLDDGLRPELGRASSMTEVVRQFDPGYQDELQWWTTPFEYPEGIPRTSLVSAGESSEWRSTAASDRGPRRAARRGGRGRGPDPAAEHPETPAPTRSPPVRRCRRCCWSARSPG